MTDFQDASALAPAGDLRWTADLPPDWTQGRTAFGGLVAALAADVAARVCGPDRPIRSLDVAFVAPLTGPVEVTVEELGAGRSATQLSVSLRSAQTGELGTRVHVVGAAARDSAVVVRAEPTDLPGDGDPAAQGVELPYLDGVTPVFTQNVRYQWCGEAFPFTGSGPSGTRIRGWCRHRTPAAGLAAVVSLLDAWPPAVLPMLTGPAPASTVRWSVAVTGDVEAVAPDTWLWFEADVVQAADGYLTEVAALYRPDGGGGFELLARGEQLIAVYDRRS
ncbi:acyl-CoA thioesterase [Spongisporangium articulatum]|uniref:Acyl-CoA thioesterase n=1 Tax=Spongisporangium articulatum TaxID=3362603 RepID=A0ABW8ALP7_9ACTN